MPPPTPLRHSGFFLTLIQQASSGQYVAPPFPRTTPSASQAFLNSFCQPLSGQNRNAIFRFSNKKFAAREVFRKKAVFQKCPFVRGKTGLPEKWFLLGRFQKPCFCFRTNPKVSAGYAYSMYMHTVVMALLFLYGILIIRLKECGEGSISVSTGRTAPTELR